MPAPGFNWTVSADYLRRRRNGSMSDDDRHAQQLGVLGERVRATRRFRGWSQNELGARTGLNRAKVSMIEGGKSNFTLDVLSRVAAAFEVHLG